MIFVDAHVHLYDCFDLKVFFDSALSNFGSAAERLSHRDVFVAVLFLTEGPHENGFQRVAHLVKNEHSGKINSVPNWAFHNTKENTSILALYNRKQVIFLIAGNQIVTAENLEVLALGTEKRLNPGEPLEKTVQTVIEADAIPVIPWGAGKWLGRRGQILEKLLKGIGDTCLFLGDNGGRPSFWGLPSHFRLAEKRGIRVLRGSDPLPFETECLRPGSFGFSLQGRISKEFPAAQLKSLLLNPSTRIHTYGKLETPFRFFQNQLAMKLLKRRDKQEREAN
ncbi:MAG: hypothetical protein ACYTEL_14190 [Planctomycetota bacterium]|jgi:hypothetical protein